MSVGLRDENRVEAEEGGRWNPNTASIFFFISSTGVGGRGRRTGGGRAVAEFVIVFAKFIRRRQLQDSRCMCLKRLVVRLDNLDCYDGPKNLELHSGLQPRTRAMNPPLIRAKLKKIH